MTRDDAHREAMHTLTDFTQSMPAEWDSGDESRAALASWLVRRDWRPVYDDDATVEKVARAIALDEARRDTGTEWDPESFEGFWEQCGKDGFQEDWIRAARAALAALRGSDV